jgi:NADH dehydrogenase
MSRPHIVILGAGFGGVYVVKKLLAYVKSHEIDVTIVNKNNYFLFTPLLHEVATGSLGPQSVTEPLREIFSGAHIHIISGEVENIFVPQKKIYIKTPTKEVELEYDYLIISAGAETNYYGIRGASENALPLKNLEDALKIRNRIIDSFERATLFPDPEKRKKILSFTVVGGGATGVEFAGELAQLLHSLTERYYRCPQGKIEEKISKLDKDCIEYSIRLVHAGKELLEMFPPKLRKAAYERLTKLGIDIHLECKVEGVEQDRIIISGQDFDSNTTIWTAGVKPNKIRFSGFVPEYNADRLLVDEYFMVKNLSNVFALGDIAFYPDRDKQKSLPMLAQVAVGEADIVAENLLLSLKGHDLLPFEYHSKGSMVSVGQWFAIGFIKGISISGRLTWWLWRTVYLFKFASWKKRLRIAFEWTMDLVFPREITRI